MIHVAGINERIQHDHSIGFRPNEGAIHVAPIGQSEIPLAYDLPPIVDPVGDTAVASAWKITEADQSLTVQWRKGPERDLARYRVLWGETSGVYSGVDIVDGADNTYFEIPGLVNGTTYYIVVRAIDEFPIFAVAATLWYFRKSYTELKVSFGPAVLVADNPDAGGDLTAKNV